jgi:iron complex outermembrane receptor protein
LFYRKKITNRVPLQQVAGSSWHLLHVAAVSVAAGFYPGAFASAQTPPAGSGAGETVLLEAVTVRPPAAAPSQTRPARSNRAGRGARQAPAVQAPVNESTVVQAGAWSNPATFEAQQARFARRPGAETVESVVKQDPGRKSNLRDVIQLTPGVLMSDRGENSQGTISIRGSDISQTGPRSGRGVRAYIDGVPVGRTESGITLPILDISAADYLEIYRGANSLRYGALATGGAINLVTKTGLTAPGARLSSYFGSYGVKQGQLEYGGVRDRFDYYFQTNGYRNDGYEYHSTNDTKRFSGNVGWRPTENIETRTSVAIGSTKQELATQVPLNQIYTYRRSGYDPTNATFPYDTRANFDYQRVSNKTVFRDGTTSLEISPYYLHTGFDHLPSPRAGIIDVKWTDVGVSTRLEHKTEIAGLPTELVAGYRPTYETANYRDNQWVPGSAGTVKGKLVYNDAFKSWLHEAYGEAAIEVLPHVRAFLGLQAFTTNRTLRDEYFGPVVPPGGLQGPGSSNGRRNYDRDFEALNPKFGASWEYTPRHFIYGNASRSTEVPNSGDIFALLSIEQAVNLKVVQDLRMQKAWTFEGGVRGAWDRFQYDVTLYHMNLKDEILSQCALGLIPTPLQTPAVRGQFACNIVGSLVPFNADSTVHRGVEAVFRTKPFVDVVAPGDNIFLNAAWTFSDFYFDNDRLYGSSHLPVIPRHHAFGELGYRHASGFYASGNVRYIGERATTFDGSGGDAFTIPAYALLGAKVGWRAPDDSASVWLEARNLTDVAYAGDFTALRRSDDAVGPFTVIPGTGRAFYAGFSKRFD